jgi:hypothetical protein
LLKTFGSTIDDVVRAFPADRYTVGLLRDDGRVDVVPPQSFAKEASRADNYMVVFEPRPPKDQPLQAPANSRV